MSVLHVFQFGVEAMSVLDFGYCINCLFLNGLPRQIRTAEVLKLIIPTCVQLSVFDGGFDSGGCLLPWSDRAQTAYLLSCCGIFISLAGLQVPISVVMTVCTISYCISHTWSTAAESGH